MHNIGDKIIYGSNGVMTIVDIREEAFGDVNHKYFVLHPVGVRSESLTFVPTDNERLVSMIRPLLTREQILDLLHSVKDMPECEWIKDNRARSEYFKNIMDSGDRAKMISMIRAIYNTGLRRIEEGKKNFLADENAMHKAENLLYSEFSIVLGIPEEEVPAFVEKEINS